MRRTALLLASTALAVLLASGVAWAATSTLSNPTRISIPDDNGQATPYPSAISVSGLGSVTDLDLKLNGFSSTYSQRVKVELVGPSGASATVMSDAGGDWTYSNLDLTLDDEATSTLPSWSQLSGGAYKPKSPLSVFDGTNPNGVWELYVENAGWGEPGSFAGGWSLTVTSEGSAEPPPPDATSPDTRLLEPLPSALSSDVNPRFAFRSSETGSTFECKLDDGPFQACSAPKKYFLLPDGQHNLQVRAKDASGNTDQTPAQHAWTVDSIDPKVTFTEKPSEVTSDRSPTWAWTIDDLHLVPDSVRCNLYDDTNDRDIIYNESCSPPYTFEGELPDGDYSLEVDTEDQAGNYGYKYSYFEVDNVAPKVVSVKPTGRRVSQWADPEVTFDDNVYGSARFVKIYKRGSTTPLAVSREYRWEDGEKYIDISPKNYLRRDTWYTVKVGTGVNDGANNLEAPKTWNFRTK